MAVGLLLDLNNLVHLFAFRPSASTEKLVPDLLLVGNPRLSKKVLGFIGIVGFTLLEDNSSACVDVLITIVNLLRTGLSFFLNP